MRIAYFDLGFSREQYGLCPTRYGGGAVAARFLKEDPEIEFVIFAPAESFDNLGDNEKKNHCFAIPTGAQEALKRGAPLDRVIGGIGYFDLILHPHTCETINRGSLKIPVVQFCGFDGSAGHPGNDYILLYNPSFSPKFGERAKYVRIGKPVPSECPEKIEKSDSFVFQCSRFDDHMGGIELVSACLDAKIPCVLAGPIHGKYPLLKYVHGNNLVRYLGEISEDQKLEYCRKARLFSILYNWDVPFSQSIIEAQGQGTPIYVPKRGPFLRHYLKHGINGFDSSVVTLSEAWQLSIGIDPKDCWSSARYYDSAVMVDSFKTAFREILAEWAIIH